MISEDQTKKKSKFLQITTAIKVNQTQDKVTDVLNVSFLLSIFDNIVGPKVVHYWKIIPESSDLNEIEIDDQLIKYISVHTLNGELYQEKLMDQLKFRLYLIKEIDHAIFSVFFDANTIQSSTTNAFFSDSNTSLSSANNLNKSKKGSSVKNLNRDVQTTTNCLSLIIPLENKDIFLKNYGDNTHFFINAFENIIIEYKVYAHIKSKVNKVTKAIDNLTEMLTQFCSNMIILKSKGIFPSHLNLTDSQFKSQNRIQVKDTYLNDVYFTTPTYSTLNNEFLINAITSHLITNCYTIVVGKTSATINKMINTLALFTPIEKLRISCYALEENSMLSPYFCLQGLVTENPNDLKEIIDSDFLFKRDSPTTIIDFSFKQVYRTSILSDFFEQKEIFIKNKVQFLYNSLSLSDLNNIYQVNNYIHWISCLSITQKSTLITNLLKQMELLESEFGVKNSFLEMVQKDIYLLAMNLIEYVNNETINNVNKKDNQLKLSIKKVNRDLDIKSEEDLNVLIAYSNYLKPGFSLDIKFQA